MVIYDDAPGCKHVMSIHLGHEALRIFAEGPRPVRALGVCGLLVVGFGVSPAPPPLDPPIAAGLSM